MLDLRRWPEADGLVDRALEQAPEQRAAWLAREVRDPQLAAEIEAVCAEVDRLDDGFLAPGGAASGPLFAALAADVEPGAPALEEGRRLGPYRVDRHIGRGGMGEVYRARDLRLGRDVAIKVLPAGLAADPARLARFEREARTLAAVSHPHIAAIHDVHEEPGLVALVLEFVEGPTLAELLGRERLPLPRTLTLARQLVDAIAAAHARGLVHRDLKPANVKLTADGLVKVLDFGLARAVEADDEDAPTGVPSITTAAHGGPIVLGTAAYMSPEQARGQRVDHRTDVWAFGCVLYEMLAGARAFEGDTASDVLARVLEREPDFARLPPATPPSVVRLLGRCLRKDPARRLASIEDARFELDEREIEAEAAAAAVRRVRMRPSGWWWGILAAGIVAGGGLGALLVSMRPGPPVPTAQLAVPLPPEHQVVIGQLPALARSADGRVLVYRARHQGVMRLFARALDSAEARPLAGTENVIGHAVSPDGRAVAFGRDGRLFTLALGGGAAVALADAPGGASLDWGPDGWIVFNTVTARHLQRVRATGGTPERMTTLDTARGETDHTTPDISPDGRHVAFTVVAPAGPQVALVPASGGALRLLGEGRQPRFLAADLLLFARDRHLRAARIDVEAGVLVGGTVQVLDGIAQSGLNGFVHYAPADDGSVMYLGRTSGVRRQRLVWLDRSGSEIEAEYEGPGITRFAVSPDATRIAFSSAEPEGRDVWVFDRARRTRGRLTIDPATDTAPVWSADSRLVAYRSDRAGGGLFVRAADGAGEERRLTSAEGLYHTPYAFTPDGRHLLFVEFRDYRQQDVLQVSLQGSARSEKLLAEPYAELRPALSPDGRWLAYQSDESGRFEIYVRPYPEVQRAKWQVSIDGGTSAVWRGDGRELFFASGDDLVSVDVAEGRETWQAGPPRRLFTLGGGEERLGPVFDIQPDGGRVLVLRDADEDSRRTPVHLVQGWTARVTALLRGGRP